MGIISGGSYDFLQGLQDSIDNVDKVVAATVRKTVHAVHESLVSKTPVYTGQTVRNYVWSDEEPNRLVFEALGSGDPGHTNAMALGAEPRRAENEAASRATLKSLDYTNPYKKYTVMNNSPSVSGLEAGELPGKGMSSRSPKGMFMLTQMLIASKLKSGVL